MVELLLGPSQFSVSLFFRRPFQIASHQRRRYKRKREKQKRLLFIMLGVDDRFVVETVAPAWIRPESG